MPVRPVVHTGSVVGSVLSGICAESRMVPIPTLMPAAGLTAGVVVSARSARLRWGGVSVGGVGGVGSGGWTSPVGSLTVIVAGFAAAWMAALRVAVTVAAR